MEIKENTDGVVVDTVVEIDPITKLEEENKKLIEERDNYKNVALKRLGKLPGDADFLAGGTDNGEMTVAEQVRLALLDKEIESNKKAQDEATRKILKENSELKLALKNRPGDSLGGDSGGTVEVKDNVFSDTQIEVLKAKAISLKADPDKFIENAKRNFLSRK